MTYRIIILFLVCIIISACGNHDTNQKSGWFFGINEIPPLEWPSRHWKGQDYQPTIQPESEIMRISVDKSQSIFANTDGLSPDQFIQNLKNAQIIESIQNKREGFFNRTVTDEIIITLDENFYTLSYADQTVITELLAKSFQRDVYILKDARTKKTVGQITKDGFYLF